MIGAYKDKRQMIRKIYTVVPETLKGSIKDVADKKRNASSFVLKHQPFIRETLKAQRKTGWGHTHQPPEKDAKGQKLKTWLIVAMFRSTRNNSVMSLVI